MTKDPLGPHEGGDLNSYRYAGNNPLSMVDPMGMTEHDILLAEEILYQSIPGLRGNINFYVNPALPPDTAGFATKNLFDRSTLQINASYLKELNNFDKSDLLNTVLHEGLHLQNSYASEKWINIREKFIDGYTKEHKDIINNTLPLVDKNIDNFSGKGGQCK